MRFRDIDLNFDFDQMSRRNLLLLLLAALLVLLSQVALMRYVRSLSADVKSLEQQQLMMDAALKKRTNSIAYYKSNVKGESVTVPEPIESAAKSYAMILNLLSTMGFGDADLAKETDGNDSVVFRVTGNGDYFMLMRLALAFRNSHYLMKLTDLSLSRGASSGNVDYSFALQTMVQQPTPAVTGEKR